MYYIRRDDSDFLVFCFSESEDAEALPSASVGNRLATSSVTLRQAGHPSALFRNERKPQNVSLHSRSGPMQAGQRSL
jgi:hypothetical protein